MNGSITASDEELQRVASAFENASNDYKTNFSKLSNLMDQITNGSIKGNLAEELRAKFEAKHDTFKALKETIDKAESYMEDEKTMFNNMISDESSGMR